MDDENQTVEKTPTIQELLEFQKKINENRGAVIAALLQEKSSALGAYEMELSRIAAALKSLGYKKARMKKEGAPATKRTRKAK